MISDCGEHDEQRYFSLQLEHFTLNERIIQFRVGIASFLVADEQFESFR